MAGWKRLASAALAVLLLTGCASVPLGGSNVEELLRAPQAGETENAVQKALSSYLNGSMQLKYPRGGAEMAPILLEDLDGDGTTEAAVLFTLKPSGQNVHLAILKSDGKAWQVAYEAEGLSTEVASVERMTLLSGGVQLAVGYANANLTDRYLAVYSFRGGALNVEYQQAYAAYYTADFTSDGVDDLVVVPPATEPGALSLQLVSAREDKLAVLQSMALDERFVACTGLSLSLYGSVHALVVDGALSSGGYASEVLRVRSGTFTTELPAQDVDVVRATTRYQANLNAADLTGKGLVLTPQVLTGVSTLQYARRFYYVQWNNYLSESPAVQFGVFDAQYGYFVRLPQEWQGTVSIADSGVTDGWQIRAKDDNALLAAVRVADVTTTVGTYAEAVRLGEKKVMLYVSERCTPTEAQTLRRGVTALAK